MFCSVSLLSRHGHNCFSDCALCTLFYPLNKKLTSELHPSSPSSPAHISDSLQVRGGEHPGQIASLSGNRDTQTHKSSVCSSVLGDNFLLEGIGSFAASERFSFSIALYWVLSTFPTAMTSLTISHTEPLTVFFKVLMTRYSNVLVFLVDQNVTTDNQFNNCKHACMK